MIKISPSILSADFSRLGSEITALEKATADMIHIDVMDGNFVPNITIGPVVIASIRRYSTLPFDVHLMINNPEKHITAFANAGADIITIHYEATKNIQNCLQHIKSLNKLAGISIKPTTDPQVLYSFLDQIDLVLIMTVEPGFGGQKFLVQQLDKIKTVANKATTLNKSTIISVDGGINDTTAKLCIEAGANTLVSGNFIFKSDNYYDQIKKLRVNF